MWCVVCVCILMFILAYMCPRKFMSCPSCGSQESFQELVLSFNHVEMVSLLCLLLHELLASSPVSAFHFKAVLLKLQIHATVSSLGPSIVHCQSCMASTLPAKPSFWLFKTIL